MSHKRQHPCYRCGKLDTLMISRTCRKWICMDCANVTKGLHVLGSEPPMLLMEKKK
jgi:hypothetical protein